MSPSCKKGVTLIEIAIVAAIIAIMFAGLAVPRIFKSRETAAKNACIQNRHSVEQAEQRYFFDKGSHSKASQDLVDGGYIASVPSCPSKGVYAWESYEKTDPNYQSVMGCSVHTQTGR